MLRRKHRATQSEWETAWRQAKIDADTSASKARCEALIEKAVSRIPDGNLMYGWSGGKDSLALQIICETAGVDRCVLSTIGERWEFPVMWEFYKSHKPSKCEVFDCNITVEYLNKHPNLVFPTEYPDVYRWFKIQNQPWKHIKDVDWLIVGHRVCDCNVCGKNGVLKNRVAPMFDFSHEDVFCILAQNDVDLPETYFYPNGFDNGSNAWIRSARPDIVFGIDSELLTKNRDVTEIDRWLVANGY